MAHRSFLPSILSLVLALATLSSLPDDAAADPGFVGKGGGAKGGAPALQPEARGAWLPDRTFDSLHLALDLAVDFGTRSISGTATHTVRPLREGTAALRFHQVDLDISAVTVNGAVALFDVADDLVTVTLSEARGPETELVVAFTYRATPDLGLHFRGPGKASPDSYTEVWSQGEDLDSRYWYPCWDHPTDRFTYEGRFTVPERMLVVSNGALISVEPGPSAGERVWSYALREQDLTSYLVMMAAGEYRTVPGQWRGRPLEVYAPPSKTDAEIAGTTARTGEMLDLFSELTGAEYPYPAYRQVFTQRFLYGGMENTTATVIHEGVLHPPRVAEHRLRSEAIVAHEAAHQWFGDLLTCRTFRELWLNEGFAQYFEIQWETRVHGDEHAAAWLAARYRALAKADQKPKPLVRRHFNEDGSTGRANVYTKGSSVLHMLRVQLGDDVFWRGIRAYVAANRGKLVETEDLRRAFEEASGLDLRWFFDQWVYGAGHPVLKVGQTLDAEAGTLRVSLKQTQKTGGLVPTFTLPVEIEIADAGGVRTERVWMEDGDVAAVFAVSAPLRWVAVDPRGGVLAEIQHKAPAAQLAERLNHSEHAFARQWVLDFWEHEEGKPAAEARAAVEALAGDASAPRIVRTEAIEVLGAWRDEQSVASLLTLLEAERGAGGSSAVREGIAQALGKAAAPQPDAVVALDALLRSDPVEQVRAAALTALSALLEGGVRARAQTALRGKTTWGRVVERAGAAALGRWGEEDDLRLLDRFRSPNEYPRLRRAAFRASIQVASRIESVSERKEAWKDIARDAEALLTDWDLLTRRRATSLLGEVGDHRSIAALEALARRDSVPSIQKAARGAIDAIRARKDKTGPEKPSEAEARIERLEERLEELEKELKELEERR